MTRKKPNRFISNIWNTKLSCSRIQNLSPPNIGEKKSGTFLTALIFITHEQGWKRKMFSVENVQSLMDHEESELWDLATALLQLQNAIFKLEEHEKNLTVLRTLASRAIEAGRELDVVLQVLSDKVED